MPLLGIAISNHLCSLCNNLPAHRTNVSNDRRSGLGWASAISWETFPITKRLGQSLTLGQRSGNMIVATSVLEIASNARNCEMLEGNMPRVDNKIIRSRPPVVELQSLSEELIEVDGVKLGQMMTSKATKAVTRTPWNKGRKHSLETIRRIKERTRLAMQDPKVKMKMQLINLGNSHTEETKMKIGKGVRLMWERHRQRLMLQETCYSEWQNLIAEAACKGLSGEEELQWDSYENLEKMLKKEWLKSVKERKNKPRIKGNKNAPKSAERRKKISEAISAKWADPEYRGRVMAGIEKFHGISGSVERKLKKKSVGRPAPKRSPRKVDIGYIKKQDCRDRVQQVTLRRGKAPSHEDPFASSKLEKSKNIWPQKWDTLNERSEAISRAKFLIDKAGTAAAALEIAAERSPRVRAALVESRMLIAEATQFLESIENENLNVGNHPEVNGIFRSSSREIQTEELSKLVLPDLGNGNTSKSSCHSNLHDPGQMVSNYTVHRPEFAGKPLLRGLEHHPEHAQGKTVKKWVRGRLVEVVEDS